MVGDACEHLSATGVDQYQGADKIWRCDGCGLLYTSRTDEDGITWNSYDDPAAPKTEGRSEAIREAVNGLPEDEIRRRHFQARCPYHERCPQPTVCFDGCRGPEGAVAP